MTQELIHNYEYIAAYLRDLIDLNLLYDIFEADDINEIMKYAKVTPDDFTSILNQSTYAPATETAFEPHNTSVSISNLHEIILTLKSINNYIPQRLLDIIISKLNETASEISESALKISNLEDTISNLQMEIDTIKIEKLNCEKEILLLKSQISEEIKDKEIILKIANLKNSDDFDSIYKFLEELSDSGNQKMISIAYKERICEKKGKYGTNALHIASENGNLKLVKSLIDVGCDCNVKSDYGYTPLHYASKNGKYEVVEILISAGANVNAKNSSGYTPLHCSSDKGYFDIVKSLISAGADKEAKDTSYENSLIKASINGHLEIVKYLITVGANVNEPDSDDYTPLMYASIYGHLEIAKQLVIAGANIEAMDNNYYRTAIIFAAGNGHLEIVKYLVSVGADYNARGQKGTAYRVSQGEVGHYLRSIGASWY